MATANRLRRRLDAAHHVILVNRDPDFTLAASYLWVMAGIRTPAQITRPLTGLRRRDIDVRVGEIEHIDPEKRTVTVAGRTIEADHLVVTLGADYADDSVPGLRAHGQTFATLPGASKLANSLRHFDGKRIVIMTAAPLYKCPAAPYEAALLIDSMLRRRGARGGVDVAIHAAEPAPMGVAGPNVSAAVTQILADREIPYHPGRQVAGVEPGSATFTDGSSVEFDLLVYMPPIKPPAVLSGSALAGPGGWIEADRHTLTTAFPGVHAIGDNVQIPLTMGKPLPRAGVFAHHQAEVVADNIAAGIKGDPVKARFDGQGGCFIETGGGRAGYGSGNFYAEPAPVVAIKPPSRHRHLAKVILEKSILRRWL